MLTMLRNVGLTDQPTTMTLLTRVRRQPKMKTLPTRFRWYMEKNNNRYTLRWNTKIIMATRSTSTISAQRWVKEKAIIQKETKTDLCDNAYKHDTTSGGFGETLYSQNIHDISAIFRLLSELFPCPEKN